MKPVYFVVLFAIVGVVIAQESDVGEQLRDAIVASNALEDIPEDNNCRQIVTDMLAGCTAEIYPNSELSDVISAMVSISEDGSISINGEALSTELNAVAGDSSRTLSAEGCCTFACELARTGCGCDENTYNALLGFFGDDAVALLQQFKDICETDNESMSFELTVFGTEACGDDFESTTSAFVCS
eukprot:g2679.t1